MVPVTVAKQRPPLEGQIAAVQRVRALSPNGRDHSRVIRPTHRVRNYQTEERARLADADTAVLRRESNSEPESFRASIRHGLTEPLDQDAPVRLDHTP